MKRVRILASTFLAAAVFTASSSCLAQATRTWVSGVGDDVNPCSRTAPCKTFAGAISKTAAGGEISALDPGGFGAVTITKSITINGDGTLAGILASGTSGIVVNVAATDIVTIRNVSIHGAGNGLSGIRMIGAGELHVDNVSITGFAQHGIDIQSAVWATVVVRNTVITDAGGNETTGGVYVKSTGAATKNVLLEGVTLAGNGRGIQIEDGARVTMRRSSISVNHTNGIVVTSAVASRPSSISIEDSAISFNQWTGLLVGAYSSARLANSLVNGNYQGLQSSAGGAIVSFGNNRVVDNVSANGAPTGTAGQI